MSLKKTGLYEGFESMQLEVHWRVFSFSPAGPSLNHSFCGIGDAGVELLEGSDGGLDGGSDGESDGGWDGESDGG